MLSSAAQSSSGTDSPTSVAALPPPPTRVKQQTIGLGGPTAAPPRPERHFARWATGFAGRMSTVLVLKDIHIYGRGISAVPRDWEPFMSTLENPLERNHKGPVGKL